LTTTGDRQGGILSSDASGRINQQSLHLSWSNATAGNFSLTARASDDGGATRTSAPVGIFVNAPADTLGTVTLPATSVELTAEGSSDWAHWGLLRQRVPSLHNSKH